MSRAYIVSRNGGTVTKAPINDNKIPIYANKTAMEADASNIPDGSIVFTKSDHDDVIDQMKEYIRNQNVLSDWETITLPTTAQTAIRMEYDGFIHNDSNNPNMSIYVSDDNGTTWRSFYTLLDAHNERDSIDAIVKYGDLVYATHSGNYASFYKLRDYSDRT